MANANVMTNNNITAIAGNNRNFHAVFALKNSYASLVQEVYL